MTETLVALLALCPLLLLAPYLGKYLDVKDKAGNAARYAAWERTVWSDPGAGWNAGENSKDDATISREIGDRLLGSADRSIRGLAEPGATRLTLWQDYAGADLVTLAAFAGDAAAPGGAATEERTSPTSNGLSVETLAFGGPVVGNAFADLGGLVGSFTGVLDGVLPELGDVIDFGLDIGERSFAETRTAIPARPLPTIDFRGASLDIEPPPATAAPLTFRQRGSILADPWNQVEEDRFADRIKGLVVDEPLKFIVFPGTTVFGETRAFPEGRQGADPDLESESRVLPFPGGLGEPEVVR